MNPLYRLITVALFAGTLSQNGKASAAIDCSIVSSCLVNNFMVIKNLLSESTALQSTSTQQSRNDSEVKIDRICKSFQPIIDCTGREAAVQCQFKIGKRGQVFRLYYLVVLCEITVKLRKCSREFIAARNASTTESPCPFSTTTIPTTTSPGYVERSVCSQQFPDVENQTDQYRQGFSTPRINLNINNDEDPYAAAEEPNTEQIDEVTGALLKIGERCDRLRLYVGCWLHYSRDMCGDQAAEIIQRMYEIYNDLSGRQCSTENPDQINYSAFEQDYIKEYGAKSTPRPCGAEETTTITGSNNNMKMELDVGVPAKPEMSLDPTPVRQDGKLTTNRKRPRRTTTTPEMFAETYEDSDAYKDSANSFSAYSVLPLSFIIVAQMNVF